MDFRGGLGEASVSKASPNEEKSINQLSKNGSTIGSLFRGRGYIQLTGRVNYKSKFYDPWIALHPEEKRSIETMALLLAEDKEIAMQASMAFFKTNCISYIKTLGDVIKEEFRKVSVAVNGGDVKTKALSSVEQGSARKSNTEKSYEVLK